MNHEPQLKFVCYYRVSTQKQGQSGLGLEAQHQAISRYVEVNGGLILAEFTETESGKKAHNRPELLKALELAKRQKAVLLIAKLDRLARNVHFISGLLETNVSFVAVDQPTKDRFMLHLQAAFAEEEARRISTRTKEALAAAKKRGVILGATGRILAKKNHESAVVKAESYRSIFKELAESGVSTTAGFRDTLNQLSVVGPGGAKWHLPNTHRTLKRLGFELGKARAGGME